MGWDDRHAWPLRMDLCRCRDRRTSASHTHPRPGACLYEWKVESWRWFLLISIIDTDNDCSLGKFSLGIKNKNVENIALIDVHLTCVKRRFPFLGSGGVFDLRLSLFCPRVLGQFCCFQTLLSKTRQPKWPHLLRIFSHFIFYMIQYW